MKVFVTGHKGYIGAHLGGAAQGEPAIPSPVATSAYSRAALGRTWFPQIAICAWTSATSR